MKYNLTSGRLPQAPHTVIADSLFPDYAPKAEAAIRVRSYMVKEVEISYRPRFKFDELPTVTDSRATAKLLRKVWEEDGDTIEHFESFKVIMLNRAHKVIGIFHMSNGGIAGTIADPKIIFQAALKANATGIIVAHNHPSGNLAASQSDINITKKLKDAGNMLEITLLDHVILTPEKYFSFADEGLL